MESDFVVLLDFREVSNFDFVRSLENGMAHVAAEIEFSPESAVSTACFDLIKLNPDKITKSKFLHLANKLDLSPGSVFELAPLAYLKSIGNALEVIGVAEFGLSRAGVDLGVFGEEVLFPLSEVLVESVVGFFGHGVLFDLVYVLDFFVDGCGVQVADQHDHAVLDSVEVKGPHIFFHLSDKGSVFVFEGEADVVGFGAVSFLYVFLEGQDGGVGVNSEFGDLEGREVVFEVDFDHG
jgi:hypothetical protein